MGVHLGLVAGVLAGLLVAHTALLTAGEAGQPRDDGHLPRSLLDTGLYRAGSATEIRADNHAFAPQYPLWSDGAEKRRWLHLPPGTWIDASRPDAWAFPVGTRLWKEFAHAGRRIETRLIQRRADGEWVYASYLWNAQGSDALLASAKGVTLEMPDLPARRYAVPSRTDCLACHEGAAVPVLGASAVQLSRAAASRHADVDPQVSSDEPITDLKTLVERGLVRNLPAAWLEEPPVIAASSPTERSALGYLHGNCGHCHNHDGSPAAVGLQLAQSAEHPEAARRRVLESAVNARSRYRPPGMHADARIIAPAEPDASVLLRRMQSRNPLAQMPPLGTLAADQDAIDRIRSWIATDLTDDKKSAK